MENICYYGWLIIENQSLLCLLCLVNKWKINIWLALLYYVQFINQWNKSLLWQSHLSHVLILAHCDFWRIFCYYVYYVYYGYYANSRHPLIWLKWSILIYQNTSFFLQKTNSSCLFEYMVISYNRKHWFDKIVKTKKSK